MNEELRNVLIIAGILSFPGFTVLFNNLFVRLFGLLWIIILSFAVSIQLKENVNL